jgi:hypothetical protein
MTAVSLMYDVMDQAPHAPMMTTAKAAERWF